MRPITDMTGSEVMKRAAALLATIIIASSADAAKPETYTRRHCVEIGLSNSVTVINADRDQQISRAKIRQAWSAALPSLTLQGSYTRLDDVETITLLEESTELGSLDNYLVTAELVQPLYSGGKTRAGLRAARHAKALAYYSWADTAQALERDIKVSFNNTCLAREGVKVRETSLEQLESMLSVSRAKLQQGAVSEFDVMSVEVQIANERAALVEAVNSHELAQLSLRNLIGLRKDRFTPEGELEYEPVTVPLTVFERECRSRPAAMAGESAAQLRKEDLAVARGNNRPTVNAMFSVSGANSYRFVSFEDEWEWHWNAGLVLQWNLWDGGMNRALILEKELEKKKAYDMVTDFRRFAAMEVRQAYLDMTHAERRIRSTERNVSFAEATLEVARKRYESGLTTRVEYTASNLALNTARFARLRALCDHMNAVAHLKYACGLSDSDFEELKTVWTAEKEGEDKDE